jgi:catechol 2,3-dioxygenase-like lactoylglutathione lyase family enzyme
MTRKKQKPSHLCFSAKHRQKRDFHTRETGAASVMPEHARYAWALPGAAMTVKQSVPFFMVSDMQASLRFYVDGLGFTKTGEWIPKDRGTLGLGVSVCFMCDDALAIYRETKARGLRVATQPFVGNNAWVLEFTDPDGYQVLFESPTDVPEETVLDEE